MRTDLRDFSLIGLEPGLAAANVIVRHHFS